MEHRSFFKSRSGLVFLVFAGIAAYFLFTEHREHVFVFLPYLFLLACPLMHLFMHGGHSHSSNKDDGKNPGGNDRL